MDILDCSESRGVPNTGGARITKLADNCKLLKFLYEDATTYVEAIERGCRLSGNGRCLGWRSSNLEYSWITYKEFMERASNFGSGLKQIGIQLGQSSIVGIYSQNCVEWLVAELGCFYYSSPIAPLYDTLGSDACTYMIKQCNIEAIICDKEWKIKCVLNKSEETRCLKYIIFMNNVSGDVKQLAAKKGIELHSFQHIEILGRTKPVPKKFPIPSDVAEICYTSGTTGNPKGVVVTHENIIAAVSGTILQMGEVTPRKNDVLISYLPLAHVFEQNCEVTILINGGSIGFFKGDITSLLDDMKILKPTFWPAVPRMLNKLYDKVQSQVYGRKLKINYSNEIEKEECKIKDTLSVCDSIIHNTFSESLGGRVRLIWTAAAPITVPVLRFYREAVRCEIVELYGQTETFGPCTANLINDKTIGSVGTPAACNMVKLEDVPDLGYFKKNNMGEICVKGYNVFKNYYKDPERTAECIDEDGWMHTGDIAMWLPNGTLKIIDRKKHIFKLSQGEYIAPEKLENIYLQSLYISQILIYGDSLKSFLVAVIVPDHDVIMSLCKENSKCSTWEEVCNHPTVKQLVLTDMRRIEKSAGLLSFEQVKRIHLHPHLLTLEDGHLTPTLKTKREICRQYFANIFQSLYEESDS